MLSKNDPPLVQRQFSPFREKLAQVSNLYELPAGMVLIVDSIKEHCARLGYPDLATVEERAAKYVRRLVDGPKILLGDLIHPVVMLRPIVWRNFPEEDVDLLNQPLPLAVHQLLHEISHHRFYSEHIRMHQDQRERHADEWAFEYLKKLQRDRVL